MAAILDQAAAALATSDDVHAAVFSLPGYYCRALDVACSLQRRGPWPVANIHVINNVRTIFTKYAPMVSNTERVNRSQRIAPARMGNAPLVIGNAVGQECVPRRCRLLAMNRGFLPQTLPIGARIGNAGLKIQDYIVKKVRTL